MSISDSIAIIAHDPIQGGLFLEYNPELASSDDLFLFAESKYESLSPGKDKWASSYALPIEPRFTRIASCIQLFDSAWCKSYLAWLSQLLLPGGCVLLPFKGDEGHKGDLMPSDIENFYRVKGVPIRGTRLVSFPLDEPVKGPLSVRGWFQENNHRLLLEALRNRHQGMVDPRPTNPDIDTMLDNPKVLDDLLGRGSERELIGFADTDAVITDLESEIDAILRMYTYVVGSIRYKSALIEHIIETLHPAPKDLSLLDMGGHMGCLAVELLLSGKGLVGRAVNREPNGMAFLQALTLFGSHRKQLRHKYHFSIGEAQTHPFIQPLDIVSIIGSLLYVPRERHLELISNAWAQLAPGGLLIVYENIKKASYSRDYKLMFEPEELDELLGHFGPIRRYPITACTEVSAEMAGRQSVFRVLQKV